MNRSGIENIVFDLGNTLCYYDFTYFYEGIANLEKRLKLREFKRYIIANKLDIKLSTGRTTHIDFFKKLKRKFKLKLGFSDFIYLYNDIFWENRYMKNFLEQVSSERKYKLFLLSNTCSHHINFINKNFPYINLIKNKVFSFRINMMKPDKKIFLYAIQKFKIIPAKTILIDDTTENIKTARKLGFKAIHYTTQKSFIRQFNKLTK